MSTVTVSTPSGLSAALQVAQAGDTILLAAGTYSGLSFNNLNFSSSVTIQSADAAHPATLTNFTMNGSSGLSFNNLEFSAVAALDPYYAFRIYQSNNVQFSNLNLHGSMDGVPGNDVTGFLLSGNTNVSVVNSQFQQLATGITQLNNTGLTISGNSFHDIQTDGIDGGGSSYVTISQNNFTNFYPGPTLHPDAIQFWTTNTTSSAHDIVISGNTIVRGVGGVTQGIFMGNELNLPYQNVTITNNSITGELYHGLTIYDGQNVTINGNTVQAYTDQQSWIDVVATTGLQMTGNQASWYLIDNVQVATPAGNAVIAPVGAPAPGLASGSGL